MSEVMDLIARSRAAAARMGQAAQGLQLVDVLSRSTWFTVATRDCPFADLILVLEWLHNDARAERDALMARLAEVMGRRVAA